MTNKTGLAVHSLSTGPDTRPDSVGQVHTPAPWDIRTLENFGFNVVHYVGGDKFDIFRVAKTGDEANARLIAAAPELLEALEAIIADCGEAMMDGYVENSIHSREVALAKAAIAKAKGGQP